MNKHLGYFISLLSSKVIRAIINLLFVGFLARILGPNGLGEWAMVIAAGALLHAFLLNWMHAPTIRFGREEWQKSNTVSIIYSARLPFLLIAFIFVGCLVAMDPTGWLERYFHIAGIMKPVVVLALFWLWLSVETQNFLQLRQEIMKLAFFPVLIDGAPVLVLLIIFINGIVLSQYVLIIGLLALGVVLWGTALFFEIRQLNIRWIWPGIESVLRVLKYSWPLIPGFLLGYVSDWGDQILLLHFFTKHEVGLFQSAYQVMILLFGVTVPLSTIIFPWLIDRDVQSSDATKEFLAGAGTTVVMLGMFLLVPLVCFAPFFFSMLLGSKFAGANLAFIVLCSAIPGSIISIFYGIFFNLQGRLWRSTVIYGGFMSILNILISLILLPRIGMIGSAVATGISYLVVQFLYLTDQHRYYRVPLFKSYILFGFILVFVVLQVLAGESLLARFMLCLVSLIAVVFLARVCLLLNREWVLRILSGKYSGLGEWILSVTGPFKRKFDNA